MEAIHFAVLGPVFAWLFEKIKAAVPSWARPIVVCGVSAGLGALQAHQTGQPAIAGALNGLAMGGTAMVSHDIKG